MSQDYPEAVYVGRYSNSWQIRRNKDDLDYDTLVEEPVAYIREDIAQQRENEAEARGAAEQRRKDAEGCEIVRQYLTSRNQWEDCSQDRIWAMAVESDATRRILYTPPPNIAALEARVKELESALTEAASALEQVKEGERGGYRSRNGKFVSLQMSDGERADIIHSEVTAECEGALATARAALTREGGV